MKINGEIKCVYAGFAYLTMLMEANDGEIPHRLKLIYNNAVKIVKMFDDNIDEIVDGINESVRSLDANNITVDYLLCSVTIFAEYYEQMRGKKRTYSPMSYKHIKEIQDTIEEDLHERGLQDRVNTTYDYCYNLVKSLLS